MSRISPLGMGLLTAAAFALVLPSIASAAERSEITIAAQHAGFAAAASTVDGVHMHLHHTLNCLEGPNGPDFTTKEIDPCKNSGHGAIPDTTDPAVKASLEKAVAEAKRGLAAQSLKPAQQDAAMTEATLKHIKAK